VITLTVIQTGPSTFVHPSNRLVILELVVRKQTYSLTPNRTVVIAIQTPVNQNVVLQIRAHQAMKVSTY
jgi:hypothetical protein